MSTIQLWEYETLYINWRDSVKPKLNEMGRKGWEVCGFSEDVLASGYRNGSVYIFKRPINHNTNEQ